MGAAHTNDSRVSNSCKFTADDGCNLCFADRGYNSKETISFLNDKLGATALGMHKQSMDYTFVFGDSRIRKRHKGMVVARGGGRAIYSARKEAGSSERVVEAAFYRQSFSGRIAAIYHNDPKMFGATKFVLVPKGLFRGGLTASMIEELQVLYNTGPKSFNFRKGFD